ncbi:MAG: L-threonylcarbamoyladenylate synthase [Terriglobales bacterium]
MAFASPAEIEHAARLVRDGRLVAFPTETVYGLGANALDADAVARIYSVKRRPATSPLIVHVASIEMARELLAAGAADRSTSAWTGRAQLLAEKFWPGPLTLVLAKPAAIPPIVTAGLSTVGLRMPSHPVALALIRAAGVPLAAPSANRFTELSPTTAEHVRQSLGGDVDCVLDGGPCDVGIESTVLSLTEGRAVLLRPGGIARAAIEAVIGPVESAEDPMGGAHPAPGMHARHYSPRTPLFLISDGEMPGSGSGIYLRHMRAPNRADAKVVQMPLSAADYAARLYGALHEADDARVDWIAVDVPPATAEWEAVHDRLRRAAFRD